MIRFLIKGVIRDKNRSRLPALVVAIGVMFTVFFYCYITGVLGDMINFNAKFSTGHLKIVTRSYWENIDIVPLDLALVDNSALISELKTDYPGAEWVERIAFGGLVDIPDENGETRVQGPAVGLGLDLLSGSSGEIERMNLDKVLVKGSLPSQSGEVLLSDQFAEKLGVAVGDELTFIGSTMYGGMTIYNFRLSGTIKFGINILDRGAVITDIEDARIAMDMQDASTEILGFTSLDYYDDQKATIIADAFNDKYGENEGEFDPIMLRLRDQNNMSQFIDMMEWVIGLISFIFILILSIILWNTGLIGGLRRYGEVGLRLAMGETKGHIYRSMIIESVTIGFVGSIIGTVVGLLLSYWVQVQGIDITKLMQDSTILMPGIFRTRITPVAFYIGFIPGIVSTVFGTMLSGIGIYKRQTARLFKELQV